MAFCFQIDANKHPSFSRRERVTQPFPNLYILPPKKFLKTCNNDKENKEALKKPKNCNNNQEK